MTGNVVTLRVLSWPPRHDECDGTYTCPWEQCRIEVAQAVARGVRADEPQPWQLRLAA